MIYVDSPIYKLGRMKMCHMVSDSNLEELHEMAVRIGVPRRYFQNGGGRNPHYDVCKAKRAIAVANGAVETTGREVVKALRRLANGGARGNPTVGCKA